MSTAMMSRAELLSQLHEIVARPSPDGKSRFRRVAPMLAKLSPGLVPAPQGEIVGDPPPVDPIVHLIDTLENLDWNEPGWPEQKVDYALHLLGYLFDPFHPGFQPLVSIVIPVHNGRDHIERALRSCQQQSYSHHEIIVVDDESTDGTAEFIQSLDVPVRLIRQSKKTAAAARNRGMLAAGGQFIHLLDADDELLPHAIEEKVQALAYHPEARLCYSLFESKGDIGAGVGFDQMSLDDPRSGTGDPMLAVTSRFPFQASAMLLARWFVTRVGGFDEEMVQAEDAEYWFRMARHDLRAVARRRPGTRRYRGPRSLTSRVIESRYWAIISDLRCADDLGRHPRLYRYIPYLITRATWLLDRAFDEGMPQEQLEELHSKLLDFERGVGKWQPGADGLTAILLDQLVLSLRQKIEQTTDVTRPMLRLWQERIDNLLDRISDIPFVTGSDLRRWLPDLPAQRYDRLVLSDQVRLKFALDQLQLTTVMGELPIRFRTLARVASDFSGHPYQRYWQYALRLATLVGDETARSIFRQKFFRAGWQMMGRARRSLKMAA